MSFIYVHSYTPLEFGECHEIKFAQITIIFRSLNEIQFLNVIFFVVLTLQSVIEGSERHEGVTFDLKWHATAKK